MVAFSVMDIKNLKEDPIIKGVYTTSRMFGVKTYLVGGVIRNLILSNATGCDYDIAMSGEVERITNLIARSVGGSPFPLDKELGSFRVTIKKGGLPIHLDLSPIKGNDILEDLSSRDFTINAMAVDLDCLFRGELSILDPFGGLGDGRKGIIRVVGPRTFQEDPVRLLRAVRFSSQYGLAIEEGTKRDIMTSAGLLGLSSRERVRDEFFIILINPSASRYLKELHTLGLLREIIGEVKIWETLRGYDLLSHTFSTVEETEVLLADLPGFIPEVSTPLLEHLQGKIGGVTRVGFVKLAAFLHDAGKPLTMKVESLHPLSLEGRGGGVRGGEGERIRFLGHEVEGEKIGKMVGRRLKLSKKAVALLARLIRNHHRVFGLASLEKVSHRSKAHFFRALEGGDGLDLLLISLADARATRGGDDPELSALVKDLVTFYFKVYAIHKPPPLLRGSDVMEILGIPEGVIIGRILRRLAEAEAEGIVKNKGEAIEFIKGVKDNEFKVLTLEGKV